MAGTVTQLNPPLPVVIDLDFFPTQLRPADGSALCQGWIDYGPEYDLIWICALDAGGRVWCVPNPKIRLWKNATLGRSDAA